MKLKKIAAAVATVGILLVTVTGCAYQFTTSEIEDTPNSVIRTVYNSWTGEIAFDYRDSDHRVETLDNCGRPNFFEQRYCENADGSVHLDFTIKKGSLRNVTLVVDGVRHSMNCGFIENDGRRGCIPR